MPKKEEQQQPHSKSISSFLSGGIAGVVAKTIIAPIERVKFLFVVLWALTQEDFEQKIYLPALFL